MNDDEPRQPVWDNNPQVQRDNANIKKIYEELDKDPSFFDGDLVIELLGKLPKSERLNDIIMMTISSRGDLNFFRKTHGIINSAPENTQKYFRYFITSGNSEAVEYFKKIHPEIDLTTYSYRLYLCNTGQFSKYKKIICAQTSWDKQDIDRLNIELHTCCRSGYWNIAEWIIQKYHEYIDLLDYPGAIFAGSLLVLICESAPNEFVDFFLQTFPNYNVKIGQSTLHSYSCLTACAKADRFGLFKKIIGMYHINIEDIDLNHLLCCVCLNGNIEFADYLVSLGADYSVNNWEPLRCAETANKNGLVKHIQTITSGKINIDRYQ